ncbi:hypothetical protein GGU11DRAFT_759874 [Lentinula aff. detonsa]|nr:hypothetical protein GGU11DRAFT_759874 [Lentinula aff. detonsa]
MSSRQRYLAAIPFLLQNDGPLVDVSFVFKARSWVQSTFDIQETALDVCRDSITEDHGLAESRRERQFVLIVLFGNHGEIDHRQSPSIIKIIEFIIVALQNKEHERRIEPLPNLSIHIPLENARTGFLGQLASFKVEQYPSPTSTTIMRYEPLKFEVQNVETNIRNQTHTEVWSPGELCEQWLDHVHIDTRAESDVQFSRVVPAIWPPVKMWPLLGYTASLRSSSFDPFVEDDELHGPPRDDSENETDTSSNAPCTPATVAQLGDRASDFVKERNSADRTSPDSIGVTMEITEKRTTFDVDKERNIHFLRKATGIIRLKAPAPKPINTAYSKEDSEATSEKVMAFNDVDRFLSRRATMKWRWEFSRSFAAQLTSEAKLEQLVDIRFSRQGKERGDQYELLRMLNIGNGLCEIGQVNSKNTL